MNPAKSKQYFMIRLDNTLQCVNQVLQNLCIFLGHLNFFPAKRTVECLVKLKAMFFAFCIKSGKQ